MLLFLWAGGVPKIRGASSEGPLIRVIVFVIYWGPPIGLNWGNWGRVSCPIAYTFRCLEAQEHLFVVLALYEDYRDPTLNPNPKPKP